MTKKSKSQSKLRRFGREQFSIEKYSHFLHFTSITLCLLGKELLLKQMRCRCLEARTVAAVNAGFCRSIRLSARPQDTLFQLSWESWQKPPVSPGILRIHWSCSELSQEFCLEASSFDFYTLLLLSCSNMLQDAASHMSLFCIPVERPGVCWGSALFRSWTDTSRYWNTVPSVIQDMFWCYDTQWDQEIQDVGMVSFYFPSCSFCRHLTWALIV